MVEHSFSPIEEKLKHIKQYYELLVTANNRLLQQAFTLKGWCITLLIAYTGFAIQTKDVSLDIIFPVIIILSFYCLEVILQASVRRIKKYIKEIIKIFDIKCEKQFHNAVSEYKFPPLLKRKQGFWGWVESFWGRVTNLFRAGWTYYVVLPYLFIFIVYYIIFRSIS